LASNFKERTVKYLNKDFQTLKRDLMDFTAAHQSGVFQDFNETSPGMAILEMTAYIGDVLSFYQDMQFEELKHETARQIENVSSFAKVLGYRPSGKRAARGIASIFVEVPATVAGNERTADTNYSPIVRAGSKLQGPDGIIFETLADVDFSKVAATENTSTPLVVTGSQFDSTTGFPTYFALRKDVEIIAGETKTDSFFIQNFEQFKTIELTNEDVIEILSVYDSDGNTWYEVDYLPQEIIFEQETNNDSDSQTVPYSLKYRAVPRRFIVNRDITTNKTSLIFGSGDGINFDDELVPNIADFSLPTAGKTNFTTFSLDPQNFLKTSTLGLSPFNTTIFVNYRVGGGLKTNVGVGAINVVNQANLSFSTTSLIPSKKADVQSSVECYNFSRTSGGNEEETVPEIKANSSAFFAAQNRVVTKEDYIARLFSLPQKFGKVEKAFVRKDSVNELALDIHVLTKDANGALTQATPTLNNNIRKYLSMFRILTDGVNIMPTDIINLRVNFGVVISPKFNRNEVLANCLVLLKDSLKTDNMQIGQPIILSDLSAQLQSVVGVISVYDLRITKPVMNEGLLVYSDNSNFELSTFDVQANTKNAILYCPENAIFQVKYPNIDIIGESK